MELNLWAVLISTSEALDKEVSISFVPPAISWLSYSVMTTKQRRELHNEERSQLWYHEEIMSGKSFTVLIYLQSKVTHIYIEKSLASYCYNPSRIDILSAAGYICQVFVLWLHTELSFNAICQTAGQFQEPKRVYKCIPCRGTMPLQTADHLTLQR